jgi:hypothetical protein
VSTDFKREGREGAVIEIMLFTKACAWMHHTQSDRAGQGCCCGAVGSSMLQHPLIWCANFVELGGLHWGMG